MNQELKYPARCTCIPEEEQWDIAGGAPEWVEELKTKIASFQPDWDRVWDITLTLMGCASALYEIIFTTQTLVDATKDLGKVFWFD